MHPFLLKFGNISIYTYGFFLAAGFAAGLLLAKSEAKRLGQDPDKIMDIAFYLLIAAIIGSRLLYVFTNPEIFLANPLDIIKVWKGGLVFYGGFIAAMITGIILLKKWNMDLWTITDIMAPSIAVGQFLGRIGCFAAGCCYGKICDLPWAIVFNNPDSLAPVGIPLHPTQLYHAFSNLIIFLFLWFYRTRKKFAGQLFWLYILLYGITRAFVEVFRGDFRGHVCFGVLSISQVVGLTMAIIAIIVLKTLSKEKTL
jgi:phosphatidylglycerol:prolipoprotein diacylglycerol transferase